MLAALAIITRQVQPQYRYGFGSSDSLPPPFDETCLVQTSERSDTVYDRLTGTDWLILDIQTSLVERLNIGH